MSENLASRILKGRQKRHRRTLIYGRPGVGKTTWASQWPNALILPTEDGCADIDCDKLPLYTDFNDLRADLLDLSSPNFELDYETYVLDSADWMESLIYKQVVREANKPETIKTVDDIGYAKGRTRSEVIFKETLSLLSAICNKGAHVILIAHSAPKKCLPASGEIYEQWAPKLHAKVGLDPLTEWADEILFAEPKQYDRLQDAGFNKKRNIPVDAKQRIIHTCETPRHLAKRRFPLPDEMPLDASVYLKHLNKYNGE